MELKQKDIEMNVDLTSFFFGCDKAVPLSNFWKKTEVVDFDQSEKSKKKL
jgi:hypothetical protein